MNLAGKSEISKKANSNPVLFVFLGQTIPLLPVFECISEDYGLSGAAYITIHEHPHDEWIKDEINRVQAGFIQRTYGSSGIIRINYLLSADYWDLIALRASFDRYLSMLYPSEIYTDIYWLLDDASALDGRTPNRIRNMEMLSKGKLTKAQVYLMSNLDSNNVFTPPEETLRTIALLSLFKDYEPSEYPVAPDASRYNEFLFADNAGLALDEKGEKSENFFLTAACSSLTVPREALKGFLISLLLAWRPPGQATESFDIASFARGEYVLFSKIVDREYIYGLAIPDVRAGSYSGNSRRNLIERLFGTRLDGILQIYIGDSIRLPPIAKLNRALQELPYYQALGLLDEQGKWRNTITQTATETDQALITAKDELKKWLDAEHNIKDGGRRRLSPWFRPENWPYRLAEEYVERLFRINALSALSAHLDQATTAINDYHETLSSYQQKINEASATLARSTAKLDAAFSAFVPKISEYFLGLFKEYKNTKALANLCDPLIQHLRNDSLPEHLAQLESFTESQLMPAIEKKPFSSLLSYLEENSTDRPSPNRLATSLSEWAVRNRRFGVQLRIGYVGLYSEANIYMPSERSAAVKTNYETQGLGRMNLFADKQTNRIDLLCQAGIFKQEDLYYKDLYV